MMHGYGFGLGDMMSSGALTNGTGWMVILMMGIGLLFVFALIAWVVWMQRGALGLSGMQFGGQQTMPGGRVGESPMASSPTEAAEQIARNRYASGEIDAVEYEALMKTLKNK